LLFSLIFDWHRRPLPCLALPSQQTEETVNCRIDHYQTPSTVYVTVFAKQTDKGRSGVKIEENEVTDPHGSPSLFFKHTELTCADTH
jgi:hypothetical protein